MSSTTATTYQTIIGGIIAQQRKLVGLSQGELADKMEISQSAWSRVEKGLTNLSIEQLVKVANVLNTQPHVLVKMADDVKTRLLGQGVQVTENKTIHPGWLLLGAASLAAIIIAANKGK